MVDTPAQVSTHSPHLPRRVPRPVPFPPPRTCACFCASASALTRLSHLHPPPLRTQDQGRRGTSFKPQSPFAKLGGAAALKKRRSSGAGKRSGAEEDKGSEERSVGKLSPWLLGLMLFAVAMYPLIQLFNTAGGKSPSRFPGAR